MISLSREAAAARLKANARPGGAGDRDRYLAYGLLWGSANDTDEELIAEAEERVGGSIGDPTPGQINRVTLDDNPEREVAAVVRALVDGLDGVRAQALLDRALLIEFAASDQVVAELVAEVRALGVELENGEVPTVQGRGSAQHRRSMEWIKGMRR